ncbi:DUF4339 domain-containing protein [Labilibaculum antarcticum]|uniref:GYF domain-containing protein n=1 Tax=Labilibaculum antarcticum TaxID=1717717 RepID=A0A1Y1CPS1_9BACT|nr:DUF4339 domain-containing protein [Labilibaculum antarcticum]BAX82365.1 hypothetical protein ALGA_4074 [Labilibaculum antarcticum]
MMNKQWYYVKSGDKKGPYLVNELKGKIGKETLLWCEGMKDWEKAKQIAEFQSFFEVTPPPVPGSKEANSKTFSRLSDSVVYAWGFVLLTIITSILELTGNEEGRFSRLVIFLSASALVRIFLGLRAYFSRILKNESLSRTMGWLIASVIPIYLFEVIASREGFEDRISGELLGVMGVVLVIALIIHVYQFVRLRGKLSNENATGIKDLRTFATLQLVLFPTALILAIVYGEEDSFSILETIIELIPLYFLITGLQKIEDRVVPKIA